MAREFRLSLVVNLPEDDFEEAGVLVKLRPIVDELKASLGNAASTVGLSYSVVTPKPRSDKGDPVTQFAALGGKLPE